MGYRIYGVFCVILYF